MGSWAVHNFMYGIFTNEHLGGGGGGQNLHFHGWKFHFHAWKCSCMKFSYHNVFMHETFRTGTKTQPVHDRKMAINAILNSECNPQIKRRVRDDM